jgi:hypothetical protein
MFDCRVCFVWDGEGAGAAVFCYEKTTIGSIKTGYVEKYLMVSSTDCSTSVKLAHTYRACCVLTCSLLLVVY